MRKPTAKSAAIAALNDYGVGLSSIVKIACLGLKDAKEARRRAKDWHRWERVQMRELYRDDYPPA